MKHILFVDDEPRILDGLRRMLRSFRNSWKMEFVDSGEEALRCLMEAPFDVIVTDMRMPGMDGATLLHRVKELRPDTIRIVLSGHTELEAAMRALPVAHYFLSKPCEADRIRDVIERSTSLKQYLDDPALRDVIGKLNALQVLPRVYVSLVELLKDPEVALGDLAPLVEKDVGVASKILHTANSGFFGTRQPITSIQGAINYLGLRMIKDLALTFGVFRAFESPGPEVDRRLEAQQRHALRVARLLSCLDPDRIPLDDAFIAGLLHDIGERVLLTELPALYEARAAYVKEHGGSLHDAEQALGVISHAEIGAYILNLWGLPFPVVEAVAHHHAPWRVLPDVFGLPAALYLADRLICEQQTGRSTGSEEPDTDYLDRIGVATRLPAWRAQAAAIIEDEQFSPI